MTVGDAHVFSWLFHNSTNTTFFSKATFFRKPSTTAEVRGKNTPERKVTSTGDQTHNHQVMSPTRSSHAHYRATRGAVWERVKGQNSLGSKLLVYFAKIQQNGTFCTSVIHYTKHVLI